MVAMGLHVAMGGWPWGGGGCGVMVAVGWWWLWGDGGCEVMVAMG